MDTRTHSLKRPLSDTFVDSKNSRSKRPKRTLGCYEPMTKVFKDNKINIDWGLGEVLIYYENIYVSTYILKKLEVDTTLCQIRVYEKGKISIIPFTFIKFRNLIIKFYNCKMKVTLKNDIESLLNISRSPTLFTSIESEMIVSPEPHTSISSDYDEYDDDNESTITINTDHDDDDDDNDNEKVNPIFNNGNPQQQMYAPQQQMYASQQQMYAPQQQMYAPQQQMYAPQQQMYAPQQHQQQQQHQQSPQINQQEFVRQLLPIISTMIKAEVVKVLSQLNH